MSDEQTIIKSTFNHVILKGSAYEVGVQQAEMIKDIPGYVQFFHSGCDIPTRYKPERSLALIQRFCPGLDAEIAGFCDALDIPPDHFVYYAITHLGAAHCSHLVVLPDLTDSQHVLVGRSYEFNEAVDDKRFCTTFIDGKYAHIGFSTLFFGRTDGMNEHGLSVTMSAGGIPVGINPGMTSPIQEGLQFWALVRVILEQCKTVDEAIALFQEFPNCGNPIFIVADPGGAAARLETYGPHKFVQRIVGASPQKYLLAANHFLSPEMRQIDPTTHAHSTNRYRAIKSFIEKNAPKINLTGMKGLLADKYPQGLCCHFYREFFGTLYSFVFDLTDKRAEISFGSPAVNPWHVIDFSMTQPGQYEALLPQESTTPEFWQPGSQE
jgi:predicted choloylglycine hydrolase